MASKGAGASAAGRETAAAVRQALEPLGEVTVRSMFGGYGIFHEDVMFAIVDSEGRFFLRADAQSSARFEAAGSARHARMPYWEVPEAVKAAPDELLEWASAAIEVAHQSKR